MDFGKKVSSLRIKVGKSQKKIEAETGIPQRTLSDWENGKSEPCVSEAVKLAVVLGVSIVELTDDLEPQETTISKYRVKGGSYFDKLHEKPKKA